MDRIIETALAMRTWLAVLSPQFAFVLALPFGVVALGFAADAIRQLRASGRWKLPWPAIARHILVSAVVVAAAAATPPAQAGADETSLRRLAAAYTDGLDATAASGASYVPVRHRLVDMTFEPRPDGFAVIHATLQAWRVRKGGAVVTSRGDWVMRARRTPEGWQVAGVRVEPAPAHSSASR